MDLPASSFDLAHPGVAPPLVTVALVGLRDDVTSLHLPWERSAVSLVLHTAAVAERQGYGRHAISGDFGGLTAGYRLTGNRVQS